MMDMKVRAQRVPCSERAACKAEEEVVVVERKDRFVFCFVFLGFIYIICDF